MIELMDGCKLLTGSCVETLKTLEANSVHTCITSPPYYGLRDYGTGKWIGGDPNCSHQRDSKRSDLTITGHKGMNEKGHVVGDGIYKTKCPKCGAIREDEQIGLEETPEEFIETLVSVFREVKRVLRDDGTLWVNIGDSYCGTGHKGDHTDPKYKNGRNGQRVAKNNKLKGYKSKDLIGIPWMLAFALRADGWYLRQDIIWAKPNPMPESVKDRCTKTHEYIFLLSKSKHYYYDHEAIKEKAHTTDKSNRDRDNTKLNNTPGRTRMAGLKTNHYTTKNKRSVWNVSCKPFKGAHFAVFPPELIEPCILAGCPKGGTVLDPFGGSGTTAGVALKNERKAILCELNPDYVDLIPKRIEAISGRSKEQRTLFDW